MGRRVALGLGLAAAILLGAGLRFANLDGKVYWYDEVFTSIRATGWTAAEIDGALFANHVLHPADLARFQRLKPDSTVADTLRSLRDEDPQHPPLYFLMARWWMQQVGDSVAASRALPALLGLLALPLMGLLAWELFRSRLTAAVAVALLALSPLDILFAQTARQYSLLTVAVIGASWLLLVALRRQTRPAWAGYGLALAVGFYTHPLFVSTVLAHGAWVLVWSRRQRQRAAPGWRAWLHWPTLGRSAAAGAFALLLFLPWLLVLAGNHGQAAATTHWTGHALPLGELAGRWMLNVTALFVDRDAGLADPWALVPRLAALALILAAFWQLARRAPARVWVFVWLLAWVPFLLLAVPDLVFGGMRSATARYLMPAWPGVQLAVAFLLARLLARGGQAGPLLATALLMVALVSVAKSTLAPTWWSKSTSYPNALLAARINAAPTLPVLADRGDDWMNKGQLLSMARHLDADVRLLLVSLPPDPRVLTTDGPLWVFRPSGTLREALTGAGWRLVAVDEANGLWQARRRP